MAKQMMWGGVALAVAVRVALTLMGAQLHLSRRVEVVTPVTSPMRCILLPFTHPDFHKQLAEGHWLQKLGLSPYAEVSWLVGSVYGALTGTIWICIPWIATTPWATRTFIKQGNRWTVNALFPFQIVQKPTQKLCSSLVFVAADLFGALLLHAIGSLVETAHDHYMAILQVDPPPALQVPETSQEFDTSRKLQDKTVENKGSTKLPLGDVAALLYLLNPFTIAVCVGGTTSPFENILVIMSLYGAIAGNTPLASFGWAISTHLSMYPAVLIIPIVLLTICGPDTPQRKVLDKKQSTDKELQSLKSETDQREVQRNHSVRPLVSLHWVGVADFLFWSALWWLCIMGLCHLALGGRAHLLEMLSETYGFVLTVEDLSPNLGLFWYFFTEVFTHFRSFFIMVFHANLLFAILPLTLRLYHRPLFLAFIMVAISTLLKSYPSVGDTALTLGLMSLCTPELTGFRFSFLIMYGYVFVAILSPSMYNLWIWRGTGNANFYFAMALVYSALQSILIVESVGTVIRFDRRLKIAVEKKCQEGKNEAAQPENVQCTTGAAEENETLSSRSLGKIVPSRHQS